MFREPSVSQQPGTPGPPSLSDWLRGLLVITVGRFRGWLRLGPESSPGTQQDPGEVDAPDDECPFPDPVEIPIEGSIDLHLFRPGETHAVVEAYLEAAQEAGFVEVRVIHGRGRGVQRAQVHRLLERDPRVVHYTDAPSDRGGWGATLVRLRERSPRPR